MAYDPNLNRLIALGGTYNPSPVKSYYGGRDARTNEGMNRLNMESTRQTMGIQVDQNARQQKIMKMKQRDNFGTSVAPIMQEILNEPNAIKQQAMYQKAIPLITRSALENNIPTANMSTVFDPVKANQVVQNYGTDQFEEVIKAGQPVAQRNLKNRRVVPHPEAPKKIMEGGPGDFNKIKPIGDTERRNMSKEFEISGMLDNLVADYKDSYSGFMSTNVADIAVAAGKRGFKYEDMANYMTKYQEWKNLVRNSLFGSQLTAPEMREFERQAINPAFTAKQNRKILKRQQELLARGEARAKLALKARNWTDEMIAEFEGSYKDDGDELTPEEMQELEMRESIMGNPQDIGKVPRNP